MDIQKFHLVGIMQRGAFYYCSAQKNRFQICYRSHSACASYLVVNAVKSCKGLLSLELVRNCPARELGSIAHFLLILHLIDLYNDTVSCKRKCLTFCVPVFYKLFNLSDCRAYPSFVRYR